MRKGKCKRKGRRREEIPFFFCCGYAVCYIVIKNGRSGKGRVCGDFLFFTCILQQLDMKVKC